MGDEYEIPTKLTTTAGGNDVGGRPPASPNPKRTSSMPSPFASTELSTRRLRSNSGGPMPHEEYLRNLTAAEMNSIAPPAPGRSLLNAKLLRLRYISCSCCSSVQLLFSTARLTLLE